jgi:hypothetical protein
VQPENLLQSLNAFFRQRQVIKRKLRNQAPQLALDARRIVAWSGPS